MVVEPGAIPVTIPLVAPIVAFGGAELVHVPPGAASDNVIVLPTQTSAGPIIGPGETSTVTVIAIEDGHAFELS